MKRRTSLPGVETVGPEVLDQFEAALDRLEDMVRTQGLSSAVLQELATVFGTRGRSVSDQCHLGTGAPAPQWEMTIGDTTLITCGHNPSHTRQK